MAEQPSATGPSSTGAVAVARPRRWDSPFGAETTEANVDRILATPLFSSIDPRQFPQGLSLREIIRNDARIVRFKKGDIVVREGDYGGSVFLVLEGQLAALLDKEATNQLLAHRERTRMSWIESVRRQLRNSRFPEVRTGAQFAASAGVELRDTDGADARTFLKDVDEIVSKYNTYALPAGTLTGTIAALSRSPRSATVFAEKDAEVVELRWQGLRAIRRRDRGFREYIDNLYRSRGKTSHLREVPIFRNLDDETLLRIAEATVVEAHGEFEWQREFKLQRERDQSKIIDSEPLIAEEGQHLDGLIVVRAGFARISKRLDKGHLTVGYLTSSELFGLDEILAHWRNGEPLVLASSLRAVGYTDVFRIPITLIEELVLPKIDPEMLRSSATSGTLPSEGDQTFLDALVDARVINGSAAMLINTDRCVSCDACVEACAVAHDNNPRFLRHGESHAQVMFANACMHCKDPVCLIGCPTGAIHRSVQGPVLIDDPTCIGCSACADACPYNNIRMVEIRDASGALLVDEATGEPIVKATNCDLCIAQPGGPACASACPHDALIRIDLRDRERLADWLSDSRRFRLGTQMAAATVAGIALFALVHRIFENSLRNASFLSGWTLLLTVVILALFGVRKRFPTLPLVDATYWARAHRWLGVFALSVFAFHTGLRVPGGVIEATLASAFLVVTMSGLGGRLLDKWIPRRMRTHGELILHERIPGFRRELALRVLALVNRSVSETRSSSIADLYTRRLAGFLDGPRNVVAHWIEWSTPLESLLQEIRHVSRYLDERGQAFLDEIEECVVAKDNLDYQWAQQLALRSWRTVHRPVVWAVVILMLVHLVLVYAFESGSSL